MPSCNAHAATWMPALHSHHATVSLATIHLHMIAPSFQLVRHAVTSTALLLCRWLNMTDIYGAIPKEWSTMAASIDMMWVYAVLWHLVDLMFCPDDGAPLDPAWPCPAWCAPLAFHMRMHHLHLWWRCHKISKNHMAVVRVWLGMLTSSTKLSLNGITKHHTPLMWSFHGIDYRQQVQGHPGLLSFSACGGGKLLPLAAAAFAFAAAILSSHALHDCNDNAVLAAGL